MSLLKCIRPIAIYLPQFHPIPENDAWWGKGFTEWTNVVKAKPLFKNHYQPHLPADLGFYDLRCIETIEQQARLAQSYGIQGFCFYHYWFSGKRLLHRPIDLMLKTKKPNFPYMLFWANETWSRRWLGEEKEILIEQTYSDEDDYNHIRWLCESVFCDERYIKINNRPVFAFYRPCHLPNYQKTLDTFRKVAKSYGFEDLYLIASNSHLSQNINLTGFDSILNFEPQLGLLPNAFNDNWSFKRLINNIKFNVWSGRLKLYDYSQVKKQMMARTFSYKFHPCVFVGWDNTPRRGEKGIVMINQNTVSFIESLQWANRICASFPAEERLLFINAWNEWAEGNHLEPDTKNKTDFLIVLKESIINESKAHSHISSAISSHT